MSSQCTVIVYMYSCDNSLMSPCQGLDEHYLVIIHWRHLVRALMNTILWQFIDVTLSGPWWTLSCDNSLTSPCQILDEHYLVIIHWRHLVRSLINTIVDMFNLKWTSHCIPFLRLHFQYNIAVRNPFSQPKSKIAYF